MGLIKILCFRRNSEEERLVERFSGLGEDVEESSKPLLADSEGMTKYV
jgi:hypothetical protein